MTESLRRLEELTNKLAQHDREEAALSRLTREGIWKIDADGKTVFINGAMAAMLGYTRHEMIGKPLAEFAADDAMRMIVEQNYERRRAGISESHGFSFMARSGSRVCARVNTEPLFDETGNYEGAIAVIEPIPCGHPEMAAICPYGAPGDSPCRITT